MILTVDDEPSALLLLETVLRRANYVVRKASSAKAALWALERDSSEPCSLVITDIRMPEMDGKELVCRMRANRKLAKIPVIMCTSDADRSTVVAMIGQGVRDYIIKPYRAEPVLQRIRAVIGDEKTVVEPAETTMDRLSLDQEKYEALASSTCAALDKIADELVIAMHTRHSTSVRAVATQIERPAALFNAGRAIDAAQSVMDAPNETEALRFGAVLVTELGELRYALQRVMARRIVLGPMTTLPQPMHTLRQG
jgi:DNA-binding response OmpR family regulator